MADFFIGDAAFSLAIGFLAGILAANFGWPIFMVAAAFIMSGTFVFIVVRKRIFLYGAFFSCVAVILGAYYFHLFVNFRLATERLPSAATGSFQVVVLEEPLASEKYLSFPAGLQSPFSGTVTVFAPLGSDVQYGDLLDIAGAILPPRSAGDPPAIFPKQISVLSRGHGFWIAEELLEFKETIFKKFGEVLPEDNAALLGGMTLGGTAGMSAALKNDMASSETLYVTSMYGYKIAVIILVIEGLFAGILPRRVRFCIAAVLAVLFVLMSGGNISAMRGGIMAYIVILAKERGAIFSKRNALAFTAAGMAAFDPTVVTQAGFLFSFVSVAGMAFLAEPVRNFLRLGKGNGICGWKQAVLFSIASLLPIIPLVSAIYGSFSLTAIFANIMIAPTIPLGMAAGAALAVTGFVSRYLAFFVAGAANIILGYALWVVRFFAAHAVPLPFQFADFMPFALYYAGLAIFAYLYKGNEA
jgi:ComEC/Rec2-related protein